MIIRDAIGWARGSLYREDVTMTELAEEALVRPVQLVPGNLNPAKNMVESKASMDCSSWHSYTSQYNLTPGPGLAKGDISRNTSLSYCMSVQDNNDDTSPGPLASPVEIANKMGKQPATGHAMGQETARHMEYCLVDNKEDLVSSRLEPGWNHSP